MADADFRAREEAVHEVVHGVTARLAGSISAEHGIGRLEQAAFLKTEPPLAVELMICIRQALDPQHLLNPGRVLPRHPPRPHPEPGGRNIRVAPSARPVDRQGRCCGQGEQLIMIHDTLVTVEQLVAALKTSDLPLLLDCSHDLSDADAGRRAYDASHIPGARHVHLDQVLSAPKTGRNGRHPLPDREDFARSMAALGADDDTQVVAYDNAGGMYAARLWWMLRWAGHRAVAVLDGGLGAWKAAGLPLSTDAPAPPAAGTFSLREPLAGTVSFDQVRANLTSADRPLINARAPDRFRGENETMDPVGGHIPGAKNRFFKDNLQADGRLNRPGTARISRHD